MKRDPYKDDQLLELVGDLCNFILDQIVHVKGTYRDRISDLGRNPQYRDSDFGFSLPYAALAQRPYPLISSAHPDTRCTISSLRCRVDPPTPLRLTTAGPPQRRAASPMASFTLPPPRRVFRHMKCFQVCFASVSYACYLVRMLQVFHLDVLKVDLML